jgi:hypothetical protein
LQSLRFQREIATISIVFFVGVDPIDSGFVSNLARPGANITGFTIFEPEMGFDWGRSELPRTRHPSANSRAQRRAARLEDLSHLVFQIGTLRRMRIIFVAISLPVRKFRIARHRAPSRFPFELEEESHFQRRRGNLENEKSDGGNA